MIRSRSRPAALRQLETLLQLEASRARVWAALRDVVCLSDDHDERWRSTYDDWKTRADDDDPGSVRGRSEPLRFHCLECDWRGWGVIARAEHVRQTGHRVQ